MEIFNWENRIREWSLLRIKLLEDYEKEKLPPEVFESCYLGYPGASEEQITATEARLAVTFPPSYREFLKVSNGLRFTSEDCELFYSTELIDRFAIGRRERIDSWMKIIQELQPGADEENYIYSNEIYGSICLEHLQTAIEISVENYNMICLLNPQVIVSDNEWEAWFFDTHLVEAIKYPSFNEMMDMILNDPELFGLS